MKLNKSFHIYGLFSGDMRIKGVLLFILLLFYQAATAQEKVPPDFMRSTGKIYVVAAVCLIILITLLIYIFLLDRKISRLEKRRDNE